MSRTIVLAGCVAALLIGIAAQADETGYQPPKPEKEHEWLKQLAGEWDADVELIIDPTKPPQKATGTESGRLLGGFFAVLDYRGELLGAPFTGALTLGYDPERKKFVGTWCDSMSSHLWQYEGTLDASGKVLTLDAEGPCCKEPGKIVKVRQTIEIRSANHRVFTSKVEQDGAWLTAMTIQYRRKA